jgi:NAD(P)-dependent dehydrogenase (short-subunit alcohol dehydrogenase family)
MAKNTARVWFITGSSTGFGRVLAEILLKRGERVAVTARNPDQIQDLVAGYKDTGLALPLDVTQSSRSRRRLPPQRSFSVALMFWLITPATVIWLLSKRAKRTKPEQCLRPIFSGW